MKRVKDYVWNAGLLAFLVLSTLVFTYPVVLHLGDSLPGYPGDNIAWLSQIVWFKKAILNLRTNPLHCPYGFHPLGMDMLQWNFSLNSIIAIPFTVAWGPILAYNLMILLSFVLSGLAFYFFVLHITKNKLASLFPAIAFAFTPFRVARSMGHYEFTGVFWIPLFLLFVHKTLDTKCAKHAILAGLMFTIGSLTSGYCGTIMLVFLVSFLAVRLVTLYKVKSLANRLKPIFTKYWKLGLAFSLMCLPILPFLAYYYSSLGFRKTHYSADPIDYVTPSPYHPITGRIVQDWRPLFQSGGGVEYVLYLGTVPIVLALYVLFKMRNNKWVRIYFILVLIFFILSLGRSLRFMGSQILLTVPWISRPVPLPMPYILLNPLPPFSLIGVASRFGLGLIVCIYVIGGIAMAELLSKIRTNRKRVAMFTILALITLFEFFPAPYPLTKVEAPPAYVWLAQQPGDFAVAEFPMPSEVTKFYYAVDVHGKKTTSGMSAWWPPVILKTLDELSFFQPDAHGLFSKEVRLQLYREVGVKYVLFHSSDFVRRFGADNWERAIELASKTEGMSFVGEFDGVFVYAVT